MSEENINLEYLAYKYEKDVDEVQEDFRKTLSAFKSSTLDKTEQRVEELAYKNLQGTYDRAWKGGLSPVEQEKVSNIADRYEQPYTKASDLWKDIRGRVNNPGFGLLEQTLHEEYKRTGDL